MSNALVNFSERVIKSPNKGGWTYMVWPNSVQFLGTRARVKVRGTMDGEPFASSFMPMGDGTHKLPVPAKMLQMLGKQVSDQIHVQIVARL